MLKIEIIQGFSGIALEILCEGVSTVVDVYANASLKHATR